MTIPQASSDRAAFTSDLQTALQRGDESEAQRLIASMDPASLPILLNAAADTAMRDRQWTHAAWIYDRIAQRNAGTSLKRCMCRNLAALQQHRPLVYQILVSLPASDRCTVAQSDTGHPSIVSRTADGKNIMLSANKRPMQALACALALFKPVIESGNSLGLCGIGDGYLFHQLAQKSPKLYMDSQQCIFLLEPDAHMVLAAMMIHDYTGPTGPIEQPRFQWFIGHDWATRLRRALADDVYLPCPTVTAAVGLDASATQATINQILQELGDKESAAQAAVDSYYAGRDPAELAALFSANPPRPPRVLFMTTRFSTVLQYATLDAAAGFQQAGWETRVLMEPSAYHRLLQGATRAEMLKFKPDLIFQIDHLRSEHGAMFPPGLPYVCWIQDHLAQLMKREAGEKVGTTDFILTDAGPTYASTYNYPARQIISLSKLTAPPPLLPAPANRGHDMIFVSNASGAPDALLETRLNNFTGSPAHREFIADCCHRAIALYGAGDSLPTYPEVCDFVREILVERGITLAEADFRDFVRWMNHPFCDALYRQQTLRWAAIAAAKAGIPLAIYGAGWDKHPEFAPYARGPVAAGPALHALTRSAAINLQVAPYLCLHQRLLDGICCGAFFLVRQHVSDIAPQAMLDLLETCFDPDVRKLSDAQSRVPPPVRDRFERLLKDCRRSLCSMGAEDPIEMVRAWQEAQLLVPSTGVLPRLDEISFTNPTSLAARLHRFTGNPVLRDEIVGQQRQSIVGRFTFAAAMQRITRHIGTLLPSEAPRAFSGIPINIDFGQAA